MKVVPLYHIFMIFKKQLQNCGGKRTSEMHVIQRKREPRVCWGCVCNGLSVQLT